MITKTLTGLALIAALASGCTDNETVRGRYRSYDAVATKEGDLKTITLSTNGGDSFNALSYAVRAEGEGNARFMKFTLARLSPEDYMRVFPDLSNEDFEEAYTSLMKTK